MATLLLVAAACALGAAPLPTGATALLERRVWALALFTVAGERDTFTALLCVTTLAAGSPVTTSPCTGSATETDSTSSDGPAVRRRVRRRMLVRRSRLVRRAAEQRLKRAELERHRSPAAERQRMERELHVVSAHHLTAVVVTAGAALGLRDRRPELADEAFGFGRRDGP
ncbi:hypothetical protein GCM10023238_17120 [Streptomyces heliomycini]